MIYVAVEFPDNVEDLTLRQAIDWWKRVSVAGTSLGTPTAMEVRHMNEQWTLLLETLAKKQGVPLGALSYFLSEIAVAEVITESKIELSDD